MQNYDVIIIGAGPAGTSSALFLEKMGYCVAVLEQAKFPRDKVCGEFISPAADPILDELGVLESIEATSPCRLKGVAISAYEKNEVCIDYPPISNGSSPMTSLSLKRLVFDQMMLDKVREKGIEVREQHKVTDFIIDDGDIVGVKGLDENKTPFTLKSKIVLDAGGRNSISLRRLNLLRPKKGAGKIALAAHWQGDNLPQDYCHMHVSKPGYTGMAAVEKDVVNIVLVVDQNELKGKDLHEFYVSTVLKNRKRREMLEDAEVMEQVRSVDSLAYSAKEIPCGGLLMVGDASGFIDPFTGEGIYLSLRSAQLASEVIGEAFAEKRFSLNHLSIYEKRREAEFKKKFVLSRILQKLIYNPPLCKAVTKMLRENPQLAETLVGVIGDYLPAERVVSFNFLTKLIGGFFSGGNNIVPADKQPRLVSSD
jgi:flavin-dependent dehydrogenase